MFTRLSFCIYIDSLINYNLNLFELINKEKIDSVWILIDKSKHVAYFLQNKKVLKSYPIALNEKKFVPEEIYFITFKPYENNVKTTFYRFCPLNYPNINDAREALVKGVINYSKFEKIVKANENKTDYIPQIYPDLQIGIHGDTNHSPDYISVGIYDSTQNRFIINDRTNGSIIFNNKDIKEITDIIEVWKTPIFIRRKVKKDSIDFYFKRTFDPSNFNLTDGEKYLNYALEYLNVKYEWDGRSKKKIDCLGLLFLPYSKLTGKSWLKLSVYPYKLIKSNKLGEIVKNLYGIKKESLDLNELKKGDILFFLLSDTVSTDSFFIFNNKKYQVWHTGIYYGENKVLHAKPNYKVIVEDLQRIYFERIIVVRP